MPFCGGYKPSFWLDNRYEYLKRPVTVEALNALSASHRQRPTGHWKSPKWVTTTCVRVNPVDDRTRQPYGLLHGGVSVVPGRNLGFLRCGLRHPEGTRVVGLEVNANHLRSADRRLVTGHRARPAHRSRYQVWQIEMRDDAGRMTCISRITMAVLGERG